MAGVAAGFFAGYAVPAGPPPSGGVTAVIDIRARPRAGMRARDSEREPNRRKASRGRPKGSLRPKKAQNIDVAMRGFLALNARL